MVGFSVGFSLASLVLSFLACCLGGWALMEVYAYKRSTHRVQFVSADELKRESQEDKDLNQEVNKVYGSAMRRAFNEGDDDQ